MAREGNESGTFRSATAAGAENLSKDEAHLALPSQTDAPTEPGCRQISLRREFLCLAERTGRPDADR